MRLVPNAALNLSKPKGLFVGEVVLNLDNVELYWTGNVWELNPKLSGVTGPYVKPGIPGTVDNSHLQKDLSPREQEEAAGMRFNTNKTRFDLIPASWSRVLAQILTKGAVKYAPRNWEKGLSWSETLGSLHRHLDKWVSGETHDEETKCHHMGHVAWNALALMTMQLRGIGKDDIPESEDGTMKE